MSQELRRQFNAQWTPAKYAQFLAGIDADLGAHVEFRISETPCFFDTGLAERMCASGVALLEQLTDPAYKLVSDRAVPDAYRVPNEAAHPMFVQVDYGLISDANGNLQPRLVEIQGFPSLYGFQPLMAEHYKSAYGLDPNLKYLLDGLDRPGYNAVLRDAILGGHDPENVILMEVNPEQQKTRCDFICTERIAGIRTVNITDLRQRGNRLYYPHAGREIPIERIYNRTIIDELERKGISAPFRWTDEIAVEWAGHPNWYFRLSKFSMPFLKHETVPETHFMDSLDPLPEDPENWVLKPLFSFAGLGVVVGPTRAELEAVRDRENYILQRRVRFDPVIDTPHGMTMAEVRLMFVWTDRPRPVNTIIRTGRGKMMGVDQNKGLEWVGASAAFYV
ncbi:MAG: hypothetical protein K2X03_12215 [Bryobacteraceae bacterium]|nr:hypothetical protein [Bryobacteraceae bacterium]